MSIFEEHDTFAIVALNQEASANFQDDLKRVKLNQNATNSKNDYA